MSDDQNLEGGDAVEAVAADLSWVPEKFRSNPEKLGEAYANLEREFHAKNQQIHAYEEMLAQAQEPEPVQQYNQNSDPWAAAYVQALENGDYQSALQIQDQRSIAFAQNIAQNTMSEALKQQQEDAQSNAAKLAFNELAARYDDFEAYREQMSEVLKQNPHLIPDDAVYSADKLAAAMEPVYKMAKAEDMLVNGSVIQQQLADTRAMKLAAQSAAGASGRSPAPDDFEQRWQEIQNAQSGKLGL